MIDGYNADISEQQRQKLREIFPEVFSENKIDWDKLRSTLGDEVDKDEKYGLSWKGKSGVFAKIQEKTVSTLHPQPEESVDWDTTQNMFIEGDNLEALKVLHKAYYGKIKMIYIDPPYNTGNDFVYNDDFAKTRREQALEEGAIDEEGNVTRDDGLRVNTGGHRHSNWLDMMYPRLFLARNLLRQDGVIFVSIDDNEVHNLRLIMNEIFGEDNFVAQITRSTGTTTGQGNDIVGKACDYMLVYARSEDFVVGGTVLSEKDKLRYKEEDDQGKFSTLQLRRTGNGDRREDRPKMYYAIEAPDGTLVYPVGPTGYESRWRVSQSTYRDMLEKNLIHWKKQQDKWTPYYKFYLEGREKRLSNLWTDIEGNKKASIDVKELIGERVFETPKPIELITRSIQLANTKDSDIILDFFSGSGTTAHAVSKLNAVDGNDRKWIMVQLTELADEKSEAYKAGFKTISEISKERIRRASDKISKDYIEEITERETPLDLGFRSYALGDSNFKQWNELMADPGEIRQATLDSLNPLKESAKNEDLLAEILLKRGISPLVELETHEGFIFIPSEALAISVSSNMTEKFFAQILAKFPSHIILLDRTFADDVNLKTNVILQAEKQNIVVEVL